MKGPAIASGVVLLVGLMVAWHRHDQLVTMDQELEAVHEKAEHLGIPLERKTSSSRRARVLKDRKASSLVEDVAGLLRQAEQIERMGGNVDEELRDKLIELSKQLAALSPPQFRSVIASLRENRAISDATKARVIGMSILHLSTDQPQQALRLFQECREILGKGVMTDHVVTSSLESWAKRDPNAALQWLNETEQLPPGMRREQMTEALLGGAAQADPASAFRILSELKDQDLSSACEVIASSAAGSTQSRDALIRAMRDHLDQVSDPVAASEITSTVMETLGSEITDGSFEEVSGWLSKQSLKPEEMASFADGLSWFSTGSKTGEWLAWISDHVPAERLRGPVEDLMGDWVEEDYIAAGKWLTEAPAGPAKDPAVKSYAEAVAAYDPEVATQWAMTLGDERMRRQTLQAIYENWPTEDQAGAERFASQHGIK